MVAVHSSKTGMLKMKFNVPSHGSMTAELSYSFLVLLKQVSEMCDGCVAIAAVSYFIN
jgi:hypothetical protein